MRTVALGSSQADSVYSDSLLTETQKNPQELTYARERGQGACRRWGLGPLVLFPSVATSVFQLEHCVLAAPLTGLCDPDKGRHFSFFFFLVSEPCLLALRQTLLFLFV